MFQIEFIPRIINELFGNNINRSKSKKYPQLREHNIRLKYSLI